MRSGDLVGVVPWFGIVLAVSGCSDNTPSNDRLGPADAAADRSLNGSGGSAGSAGSGGGGAGGAGGAGAVDASDAPVDAPVDATLEPFTVAAGLGKPTGIALSETAVYWADETRGTISTCPKAGCGAATPTIVAMLPSPRGIALRGSVLYMLSAGQNDAGLPASVRKCTLGACTPGQMVDIGPAQTSGPFGNVAIAVDDHAFYVVGGPYGVTCPNAGCADAGAHTLGLPFGPIFGVAVDATTIYLGGPFRGLDTCPLSGCTGPEDETKLISHPSIMAVANDETNLYWSEYSLFDPTSPNLDGAIRTCPRSGCNASSATVLAAGFMGPYAMAVDADSLYYTDYRNGRVERISKKESRAVCAPNHYGSCEACTGQIRCDGTCSGACDAGSD